MARGESRKRKPGTPDYRKRFWAAVTAIVLLFLPQKLYFQAMRYEKYIMGVVLLLVFFGLLNTPLNLCVNAAWRLLLNLTGFVELLFGIA